MSEQWSNLSGVPKLNKEAFDGGNEEYFSSITFPTIEKTNSEARIFSARMPFIKKEWGRMK